MRAHQRARLLRVFRNLLLTILAANASGAALAQTPLAMTVHTVTAVGQPPAVEHDFTITNAGSYSVTLTDLGSKLTTPLTPAPLASVAMAVTQGASVVGTPVTSAGQPINFTATANTTYTIHVVGIPGTQVGSGPIEEDVTDSSGKDVFSSIDTLSPPSQPSSTAGTLEDVLTVQNSGSYTVSLTDLAFPTALESAELLLIDNTTQSSVLLLSNPGQNIVTLAAGDSYQIIAFGVEASGAAGGLFGVAVTPAAGAAVYSRLLPVGAVTLLQTSVSGEAENSFTLTGAATLSLTDLDLPTVALSSAGAAVVDATAQTLAAAVTGTGAQNIASPSSSDAYEVFAYAIADSTAKWGSYAVSVQQGTSYPFLDAQAVSTAGSTIQAFSLDTSVSASGSYVFTLTDFKFPATLTADALVAVQDGQAVGSIGAAGNFTATLAQGPVMLLAFGEEGSSGGLLGVDLTPATGGVPVFDVTEGIGTGFSSTTFTAQSAQAVQANVADLKFPAALANLNLAVTSGTSLVGEISSAGSAGNFDFTTSANKIYNVNVLAQPASAGSSQEPSAGTYAMSVDPAPVVTLTASSTSVTSGGTVTLTWTAENATSCTASASPANSGWDGSESATGGGPVTTAALTATTTFSLSCSGGGGTVSATPVTVSVTAAQSSGSGGGGVLDFASLVALAALAALRAWVVRSAPSPASKGT